MTLSGFCCAVSEKLQVRFVKQPRVRCWSAAEHNLSLNHVEKHNRAFVELVNGERLSSMFVDLNPVVIFLPVFKTWKDHIIHWGFCQFLSDCCKFVLLVLKKNSPHSNRRLSLLAFGRLWKHFSLSVVSFYNLASSPVQHLAKWTRKWDELEHIKPRPGLPSWHWDGEALLGWRQTGWELVCSLCESIQLHIISHKVHRETERPTFPSVANPRHRAGAITELKTRGTLGFASF